MSPERELARLYAALGDHRAGGSPGGVFDAHLGGPGSAPELADLGAAEWQLDLLPFPPSAGQRAALNGLGYALAAERPDRLTFTHPDGLDVVLLSHDLGASFEQRLLWLYLQDPSRAEARARYRRTSLHSGRDAADAALIPQAQAAHLARTGFAPLERAATLLEPLGLPWMFAAGWALDLHRHALSGHPASRPHEDLDVILPREAQRPVCQALVQAGYTVHGVREGVYGSWQEPLDAPDFQLHAHRPEGEMLDLMLTDLTGGLWHYRRDPAVTLPLTQARRHSPLGLPYLAPEAALLFKANVARGEVRPKDQRDFEAVLPTLDAPARAWLAGQIGPGHGWFPALER